jgi:hypothetical protein
VKIGVSSFILEFRPLYVASVFAFAKRLRIRNSEAEDRLTTFRYKKAHKPAEFTRTRHQKIPKLTDLISPQSKSKMKFISVLALPGLAYAAVQGFDISHYQETVDYQGAYDSGARFVMIKVFSLLPGISRLFI